jgi:diaminopimelate decarboxylase
MPKLTKNGLVSDENISTPATDDETAEPRHRHWVFDRVVTEFGAASHVKFGWLASRVEYVKECDNDHRIALIHAGSDLFLRACYAPEAFGKHRTLVYDEFGLPRDLTNLSCHDIAGPLCFSGDVVVRDAMLPPVETNDIVVLLDCGGNCMSLKNMHCSRQMPTVYGYKMDSEGAVTFEVLKKAQTIQESLKVWE